MIDSGEADSRAIAGAVRGAIGQARLDAGVNITGLLVDMGSAESVDYRRHFMCWQLTRVLRPSLTEKVPAVVVRRVVKQETARLRTGPLGDRLWRVGLLPSDLLSVSGDTAAETRRCGYGRVRTVPSGFADTANVSAHQELCCTTQPACV